VPRCFIARRPHTHTHSARGKNDHQNIVPVAGAAVPLDVGAVPVDAGPVPVDVGPVPVDVGPVPADGGTVPDAGRDGPVAEGAVPVDVYPLPVAVGAAPEVGSSIPVAEGAEGSFPDAVGAFPVNLEELFSRWRADFLAGRVFPVAGGAVLEVAGSRGAVLRGGGVLLNLEELFL
jgi:hypothetical protein